MKKVNNKFRMKKQKKKKISPKKNRKLFLLKFFLVIWYFGQPGITWTRVTDIKRKRLSESSTAFDLETFFFATTFRFFHFDFFFFQVRRQSPMRNGSLN